MEFGNSNTVRKEPIKSMSNNLLMVGSGPQALALICDNYSMFNLVLE